MHRTLLGRHGGRVTKFHDHDVGVFADVSVNVTDRGATPDDTDFVNDATGAAGGAAVTVTVWATDVFEPAAFVAVSVTSYVPAVPNTCTGLCTVDTGVPSPKFHDHDVGPFADASVKVTVNGATPDAADFVNDATGTEPPPEPVVMTNWGAFTASRDEYRS